MNIVRWIDYYSPNILGGIIIKQFFNKSPIFILFFSSVFFIICFLSSISTCLSILGTGDSKLITLTIVMVLILLLMNSFEITRLWISGKIKEIYIKKLVGIPNRIMYLSLTINYFILILIASIIGCILTFIAKLFINSFFMFEITFFAILFSFISTFMIGLFFVIIICKFRIAKEFGGLK